MGATAKMSSQGTYKCEVCGVEIPILLLIDDEVTYVLCPNHLFKLVTHSLTKDEAMKLINNHGNKTFYLHDDFYAENGEPLQPMV